MLKIFHVLIVSVMLWCSAALAQLSIGIGFPHVSIGINLPVYPELVAVPGYPVYYAPQLEANFFFYDGMYWVYQDDNWYSSSWYNGPWWLEDPELVPLFVLRIPVRYYRRPPLYFRGWYSDAPPRWGDHWGGDWEQRRSGWDRWDHRDAPPPAPLPIYQRRYSKDRYPVKVEEQHKLQQQHYRYQPHDPVVRKRYQEQEYTRHKMQRAPDQSGSEKNKRAITPPPQQRPPEAQDRRQPHQPEQLQRNRQIPQSQRSEKRQQDRDAAREVKRKHGQEQDQEKRQERGRDRNE